MTRKLQKWGIGLLGVAAVGLLVGFASVTRETNTFPIDGDFVCGNSTIHLVGTAKARIQYVENANGFKGNFKLHADATGTDQNGASYNLNENETVNYNVSKGGSISAAAHAHLIGQGEAPDYNLNIHFKVTQNANGDTTAEFERIDGDCTGNWPVPDMPLALALMVPGLALVGGLRRRFSKKAA